MKPAGPVARVGECLVGPIAHTLCASMIRAYHYSGGAANTSVHAHGLVRNGMHVASALWMPPTANAAKALALRHLGSRDRHREVLVLSRLVVVPGEPQNVASMLLGGSERLVRKDARWSLLVTYADEGEGHTGAIYRATNWIYAGFTKPETRWRDAAGKLTAKHATRSRTVAEMLAAGCVKDGATRKHRFVKVIRMVKARR